MLYRRDIKGQLAFALILGSLISSGQCNVQSLAAGSSEFAANLFREIGAMYDNVVFSPYSLHSALSMTSMGASGQTLREMRMALGVSDIPEADVHQAYMDLVSSFMDTGDKVEVLAGNAIFQNPRYQIGADFKGAVEGKYDAMAQQLNFSAPGGAEGMINDYVEEKTNDMIKDLFPQGALKEDETKLVLVNTLFFNGSWAMPFDKSDTKQEDFHVSATEKKKVDMMMQEGEFAMKMTPDYQAIKLPFVGNRFALYIAVANESAQVTYPDCLPDGYMSQLFTDYQNMEAKIYIPKFEINFKKSLPAVLKKMGMMKAFSSQAEFSMISPGTMLSEVLHQAVIQVTEPGTTAAAATAVVAVLTSIQIPKELPEFRADRPFLFFLRDDTHGEILFQGKFGKPQDNPKAMAAEVQRAASPCSTTGGGGSGEGGQQGGGGDGASTLSLAFTAWAVSLVFSVFTLRRVLV